MKTILGILLGALLTSQLAFAASVKVTKSEQLPLRAQELKQIITDYENMCDSGCTYKVTNLVESKILEDDGTTLITWQSIKAFKPTKNYTVVTITEDTSGTNVRIDTRYPTPQELTRLTATYAHAHDTMFDGMASNWELVEVTDAAGQFLYTEARYAIEAEGGFLGVSFVKNLVENELKKATDELFTHFQ